MKEAPMQAKRVLLGVTGGIAAYKACELVRLLVKEGRAVRVLMTDHARRFVAPLTFEVLSGRPVACRLFAPREGPVVEHVEAAAWCDLFCIAPATANIIGKLAAGIADDLLTTTALALPRGTPRVMAPAMNERMWANALVQRNLRLLESPGGGGYRTVPPVAKELACGDFGMGGLAAPEEILRVINTLLGEERTSEEGADHADRRNR